MSSIGRDLKQHVWLRPVQEELHKGIGGLKRILPYCFEMHGKCHYVDENLHEVSIPYEEIIPWLQHLTNDGFIVTEYEDVGGYVAIEQTTRHVVMVKKVIEPVMR